MVYLSVEGVGRQLVSTIEGVGVGLTHDQTIFISIEDFSLINGI